MTPDPRSAALQEKLLNARIVAEYWRDEMMKEVGSGSMLYVCAHPLACVIGALDGETAPKELGIPDEEYRRRSDILLHDWSKP